MPSTHQADGRVVTVALQELLQQLFQGRLLQAVHQHLLPHELHQVQALLHQAELEVGQPPHPRAVDVLQLTGPGVWSSSSLSDDTEPTFDGLGEA